MSSLAQKDKQTPTAPLRRQTSKPKVNGIKDVNQTSISPEEKQRKSPCARALHSFKAERSDEITFSKGVSIRLIRRVNAEWLEGELDGTIGIFPANYVTIEVGLPSGKGGSDLANSGHPYARAMHDFRGGEKTDLPFRRGELIHLKSWGKGGWLVGSVNGKQGLFPASYVDVIEPLPSPKVERRNKSLSPNQGSAVSQAPSTSPVPRPRNRAASSGSHLDLPNGVAGGNPTSFSSSASPSPTSTSENKIGYAPSKSVTVPRSSTTSLSSLKAGDSRTLPAAAAVNSPLQSSCYVIESRGGGSNSESGGSSSEEVTTGTVPVLQVEKPPPIPAKKRKRHSVNSYDSVYMNEEGPLFAVKEPEPVHVLPSATVNRRANSAQEARSKRHTMVNYPSDSYLVSEAASLGKIDSQRRNGGLEGDNDYAYSSVQPVPKPRASSAKGAPNRLPPSPPLVSSSSSSSSLTVDESREEEADQELFPGACSPSHPLQKVNERLAEVREMVTSQEKLIQSACGLLRVTQDAGKRAQLIAAVESREGMLQGLHRELAMLKEEKVRIQKSNQKASLPTVPEPPRKPLDKKAQKMSHRKEVIDELVRTEKEYCQEVEVCLNHIAPLLRKCEDFDCDILLGNMADVCLASKTLISEMEENRESLGLVFSSSSKPLLAVYTVYCKNHNLATVQLKKYLDDPMSAAKLSDIMQQVKDKTKAWDLGSLLIKPVQRVLKYPLLLSQLKKETDDKHEDMSTIQKAELDMKEVADAINEAKRRKELVERYTDPSSKGVHMKAGMKHSVTKKVDRFITAMTQFAGLRNKTVDSKFEDERSRFLDLQEVLKSFQKGVTAWLKGIKDVFDCHQKLTVQLVEYCADRPPRQLAKYGEAVYGGLQMEVKSHTASVELYILDPLRTTLAQFQEPAFIIHKRDQKLLDFDHVNHELEKAKESDKIATLNEDRKLAKRTYTAMNQQLMEDLPEFRARVQEMQTHLLAVLCKARLAFHRKCVSIWTRHVLDPEAVTSTSAVVEIQAQRLSIACQRSLVHLRCVGTSALTAAFRRRSSALPTSEASTWPQAPPDATAQEEEESVELKEGQVLEVLYDFEAQESSVELAVEGGDYVTLVAPHDQLGCGEWWLVQNGQGQGYVPALYLKVVPKHRIPDVLNDSFETVVSAGGTDEQDDSVTLDSFLTCSDTTDGGSRDALSLPQQQQQQPQSTPELNCAHAEDDDNYYHHREEVQVGEDEDEVIDTQEIDRAVKSLDCAVVSIPGVS